MEKRLKRLRLAKGMSQQEFADAIDYSQSYLAQVEKGQRKFNNRIISLVCDRFGVNEQWLRSGAGEMFRSDEPLVQSERELAERYLMQRIRDLPDDLKKEILRFCQKILEQDESDKKNASPPVRAGESASETQDLSEKLRKLA